MFTTYVNKCYPPLCSGGPGTLWTPLVTALEDSIANLRKAADHAKFILLAQFHRIKIMF